MRSHPAFKVAAGLWFAFGIVSLFLPFFPQAAERFYSLTYLPRLHWYVWVIGILVIALTAVVEGGRSQVDSLNPKLAAADQLTQQSSESWKDLYSERKKLQDELEALEARPEPPDVPFEQLTVRPMTAAEMDRQLEKDRKIERKKQELKLIDERLKTFAAASPDAVLPNDPRVYPEIEDRTLRGGFFAGTPFVLRNNGGDVAHKCSIDPLTLHTGRVTFETVDTIPAGRKAEVRPGVEHTSVFWQHDIKAALMKEWNASGEASSEFSNKMQITYEDFRRRKFETSFELVY
jgi:hypothetical protein